MPNDAGVPGDALETDVTPPSGVDEGTSPDFTDAANARIRDLNSKRLAAEAKLAGALSAVKQPAAPAAPAAAPQQQQFIPLSVLRQKVDAGEITQEQMDAVWENQIVARATQQALATFQSQAQGKSVEQQIAQYKELVPAIVEPGTPDRTRITKEFQTLVANGSPNNLATELAALRVVYGDVNRLAQRIKGRPAGSEATQDGGSGTGDGGSTGKLSKFQEGLTPKQREYYRQQIDKGTYKDWSAVEAVHKPAKK